MPHRSWHRLEYDPGAATCFRLRSAAAAHRRPHETDGSWGCRAQMRGPGHTGPKRPARARRGRDENDWLRAPCGHPAKTPPTRSVPLKSRSAAEPCARMPPVLRDALRRPKEAESAWQTEMPASGLLPAGTAVRAPRLRRAAEQTAGAAFLLWE